MAKTKTQYDAPHTFNNNNLISDVYRKWVVEIRQHVAKNTIHTHIYIADDLLSAGTSFYGTPFYDTRAEARRSARAIRGNYGWKTRVRRYAATK